MKRILAVLLCLVLVLSMVTACGSKGEASSDGPVTIRLAAFHVGVNASAPWFSAVVDAFNQEYDGKIKLEIEEIPGDQAYVDKMKTYISMNDLPDLFFTGGYKIMDDGLSADSPVDPTPYFEAGNGIAGNFFGDYNATNYRRGKIL